MPSHHQESSWLHHPVQALKREAGQGLRRAAAGGLRRDGVHPSSLSPFFPRSHSPLVPPPPFTTPSPQERREVEQALHDGRLMAVAATNALELGVDIGSLDLTLHLGFPGSVASLWQQVGGHVAVGRGGEETASQSEGTVVLVPAEVPQARDPGVSGWMLGPPLGARTL